ncbi:MAG: hypothetical protein IPG43_20665 [Proteobacteria bacterium]|nr:hypothetical protein [Pseudomonadota bacterium]
MQRIDDGIVAALQRFAVEQRGRGRRIAEVDDAPRRQRVGIEGVLRTQASAREILVAIGQIEADEQDEVGAIAQFRQRGRIPATGLQQTRHRRQRFAVRMIEGGPAALGKIDDRTHAVDVGGEAGEQRLTCGLQDFRRGAYRGFECDFASAYARCRRQRRACEVLARAAACVARDGEPEIGRRGERDVIAQQGAERTYGCVW